MQQNILRDSNITKVYLLFVDGGARKRLEVKLRFIDKTVCYFATPIPMNFSKPKKKIPAELNVYTSDGIYKTKITLIDCNASLREVLYEVSLPKIWDYIQLRSSTRVPIELPFSIKFNDGYEVTGHTCDLAVGGFSFFSTESIPSIYKKIMGILTLELPKDNIINFPDGKMIAETKFVREKSEIENHFGETLYIYKFLNLPQDGEMILKNYLIKISV